MDPMQNDNIGDWVRSVDGDVDYLDFLSQRAELSDWIAMARVLNPQFVEVDGCVLWDRVYDEQNFCGWLERLGGDRRAVEEKLNRLRLWQFIEFSDSPDEIAEIIDLAHVVADSWRRCLRDVFPSRHFQVTVYDLVDGPEVGFSMAE